MSTTQTDVTQTIKGLVETCRDGQEGFKLAADAVKNSPIEIELRRYSRQRQEFARELADAVSLGDEPAESGSVTGSLHRAWMNIKQAVTSHDLHAILGECERGEDSAVEAYRSALETEMRASLHDLVEAQYEAVLSVHNRIKLLRERFKRT